MSTNNAIWLSASIAEGVIVYLPKPRVGQHQPGTATQQLAIADLAARNPWGFADSADAYRAARRTILQHARRAPR